MRIFSSPVIFISMFSLLSLSCAEFKQAGRDIGHGTRDVTREIGHGTRDVTRTIGHETRDAIKAFKKDVLDDGD